MGLEKQNIPFKYTDVIEDMRSGVITSASTIGGDISTLQISISLQHGAA